MEYSYDLRRIGNHLYVSVEPLLKDIEQSVKYLNEIDVSNFNEQDREIHELKIKGLVTIHQFMHGFLQEEFLRNQKLQGKITLNTKTGTIE